MLAGPPHRPQSKSLSSKSTLFWITRKDVEGVIGLLGKFAKLGWMYMCRRMFVCVSLTYTPLPDPRWNPLPCLCSQPRDSLIYCSFIK